MAKHRDSRVNEELRKEISDILLHEIKDPDVGFVSIVKADVSHDLSSAKIYYSVMGSEKEIAKTQKAMKRSAGYIRHELAGRLSLRHTPELIFVFDDSIEHGIRIAKILEDDKKRYDHDETE